MPVHEVTFTGRVEFGALTPAPTACVLVCSDAAAETGMGAELRDSASVSIPIAGRATRQALADVVDAIGQSGVDTVVGLGAGTVLDLAKAAGIGTGTAVVLLPAGPEPWRAVTAFATIDNGDGTRTSTPDRRLAAARVILDWSLWTQVPGEVLAVHRLDSVVHAIECLLSRRAQPYSDALSMAALDSLTGPDQPVQGVMGAFLAAEAFGSTKLGIAHALAGPLGATLGISHDTLNCVIGCLLPRIWPDSPVWPAIAGALGAEPSVSGVEAVLAGMRDAAGLPPSLRQAGIDWSTMHSILDGAAASSGMPWLPRTIGRDELELIARMAWEGAD